MIQIDPTRTINNIRSVDSMSGNIVLLDTKNGLSVLDQFYFEGGEEAYSKKFIKSTEKIIRTSKEYSDYLSYLVVTQGLNRDSLMADLDQAVTMEFHHYPFTLFDICSIVLDQMFHDKEKITTFSLARKVLQLHYDNKVGLVKLSKTNHELAHSGDYYIPLTSVFGDVNQFILDFYNFIPFSLVETYNRLLEVTDYDNSGLVKPTPISKEVKDQYVKPD